MRAARIIACVALAYLLPCTAPLPAHAEWRDGFCRQGEGQTVIVDWRLLPGATGETRLVRCIAMDPAAPAYPVEVGNPLAAPLDSTDVPWAGAGMIDTVGGITAPEGWFWAYSSGEVTGDGGQWRGAEAWQPVPGIDTFAGITLMQAHGGTTVEVPEALPQFSPPSEAQPTVTPTSDTSPPDDATQAPTDLPDLAPPSTAPPPELEPGPTPVTPEPTPSLAPSPADGAATPPPTLSTATRPSQAPPPPTHTPTPTPPTQSPSALPSRTPPPPHSPTPTLTPTPPPSSTPAPPSATPSPVWGRESAERLDGADHARSVEHWEPSGTIALGVAMLGGLGAAATLALRPSTTEPLEDE